MISPGRREDRPAVMDFEGSFLTPRKVNAWGSVHYEYGDERIPFETGQRVEIRWPDGRCEYGEVRLRDVRLHVDDVGREDEVKTQLAFVEIRHHGQSILVPVEQVQMRGPRFVGADTAAPAGRKT